MLNTFHFLNSSLLAKLEVGEHYYWKIGGLSLHGQVFITSWIVCGLLIAVAFLASRNVERIPSGLQNLM